MSTKKSHVGLGYTMCAACGAEYDEVVLLDTRLEDSLERKTQIGVGLCPTHRKMVEDGFLVLVEMTEKHGQRFFCGGVAGLKKDVAQQFFTIDISKHDVLHVDRVAYASLMAAVNNAIEQNEEGEGNGAA